MSDRDHGYARYKLDNCRCYVCGYANHTYCQARERAIAYGTWQPYVDAEPARQHVRNLQACGLGTRRIAELAGIERKRITDLVNGRTERGRHYQTKIRPDTAAKLLAIEPTLDNLGSATVIDGTGTRRRIQALIAAGWPQAHLATRLGMTGGNFGRILKDPRVTVRTARAVRALYDQLWRANPLEHGAAPCGITRAKRYAADRNWAPAGAWDDDTIDDPAAQPDLGQKASRQNALVEDIQWLETQGYTREQATHRLGVTRGAIDAAMSRANRQPAA